MMTIPTIGSRGPKTASNLLDKQPVPGVIVLVDWRDKHFSPEPGKLRPAIVVANSPVLTSLRVLTVVALTGDPHLAPPSLSTRLDPGPRNGLKKPSYALAWNIQTVGIERVTITRATITSAEVDALRRLLFEYLTLDGD